MRLKQIKLAGFKSFVDPTKIPFDHPLSAIIGPNGCGKSNVIDAVRWVLGESSAKNLRGDSMTDVIFNGSSSRRPISVAGVELVFENLDGRLAGQYASYQEISVKRQVNRDSESSYFLNGQKCRRKDITDLFMGTGLGPRSYAIIEQGTISRLIESKPQDLRIFIEEAAGISRYKERRRETENRIRHTRENLERLNDIRVELGAQIDKLSQQAKAALQYREFKQSERELHSQLLVMRYQDLLTQTADIEQQVQQLELNSSQLGATQQSTSTTLEQLNQQIAELTDAEHKLVERFYQSGTEVAKLEQQLKHQQHQDSQLIEQREKLQLQLDGANQQFQTLQLTSEQIDEQYGQLQPLHQEAETELAVLDEQLSVLDESNDELQLQLSSAAEQLAAVKMQFALAQSRLEHQQQLFTQLEAKNASLTQELAHLNESDHRAELDQTTQLHQQQVQSIIQSQAEIQQLETTLHEQQITVKQAERAYNQLQQTLTAAIARHQLISEWITEQSVVQQGKMLWQVLDIKSGWESAIELALAGIVDMSVGNANADFLNQDASSALGGFIEGELFEHELLTTNVNLAPWLAHLHWAENLDSAKRLLTTLPVSQSVVTQDGFWVGHGFTFKRNPKTQSALLLTKEADELTANIASLTTQVQAGQLTISDSTKIMAATQLLLNKHQQQCHVEQLEQSKLESRIVNLQQQVDNKHHKQQQLQQALADNAQQIEQHQQQIEALEDQVDELADQVSAASALHERNQHAWHTGSAQLRDIKSAKAEKERQFFSLQNQLQRMATQQALSRQQIQQQKDKQDELTQALLQLEQSSLKTNDAQEKQLHEQLTASLNDKIELQQALQQQLTQNRTQQAELQSLLDSTVIMQKQQLGALQGLTQSLSELKLRREGLKGQANAQIQLLQEQQIQLNNVLSAIPEHANVDEWSQLLDKVRNKIVRLGAINLAAIDEYETQTERKNYLDSQDDDLNKGLQTLEDAIRKIDRETRTRFKTTFDAVNHDLGLLFPKVFGGGKAYLALTDDDLLETGVTIMAQPPGKKNSTIHLLSGGEKALTALSLVFAIFRLNPAPFCMLDEVDAPLDDANVERFCRLLKEMSQSVQFIYISHNKITMEMADQLIGVTMHEPGVSRIVAVDIEAAVALADAL